MTAIANPLQASTSAAPVRRRLILVVVLVGYFMVILDNSIVFTGVPSTQRDLGLDGAALSWV